MIRFGALNGKGQIISWNPCDEIPLDPENYAKPEDPDWVIEFFKVMPFNDNASLSYILGVMAAEYYGIPMSEIKEDRIRAMGDLLHTKLGIQVEPARADWKRPRSHVNRSRADVSPAS
jgi:hypothetical protein